MSHKCPITRQLDNPLKTKFFGDFNRKERVI
jgi:hypothetical protein